MNIPNSYFETGSAVFCVLMFTVNWAGAVGSACWAAAVAVEAMQNIVALKTAMNNFLNEGKRSSYRLVLSYPLLIPITESFAGPLSLLLR